LKADRIKVSPTRTVSYFGNFSYTIELNSFVVDVPIKNRFCGIFAECREFPVAARTHFFCWLCPKCLWQSWTRSLFLCFQSQFHSAVEGVGPSRHMHVSRFKLQFI